MSDEQPRHPAGSPDGGQFATFVQAESDVELGRNLSGTWYSSPDFLTADALHGYFAEHPPPDDVVARFKRIREEMIPIWQQASVQDQVADALHEWDQENPAPAKKRIGGKAEQTQHKVHREAFVASLAQRLSAGSQFDDLSMGRCRTLCTLTRMWWEAHALPDDERRKVHERPLAPHQDKPGYVTLDEFVHQHQGERLTGILLDPDAERRDLQSEIDRLHRTIKDRDREIVGTLEALSQQIAELRGVTEYGITGDRSRLRA